MSDARRRWRDMYPDRVVRQEGGDEAYELELKVTTGTVCGESLTRQSDLAGSDIHNIVKRYMREGVWPVNGREGVFLDVSEVGTYRDAVERVRATEEYFQSLPADARAAFDNDARRFVEAVADPQQLDLLVEAGLVPPGEIKGSGGQVEGSEKAPEGAPGA